MIWVYKKTKEGTVIYGSYPKKKGLKLFKGKEDFIILDSKTGENLNLNK